MVRALKDAEICASITTSQLDLLLTKIHCAKAVSPVGILLVYMIQYPRRTLTVVVHAILLF